MIGHVDRDGICRNNNEIAIAAIAAAVHLRVCARAHERREHHLKKFLFHSFFLFIGLCKDYAPLGGVPQAKSTP
jgi:hypothetical protein